VATQTGDVDWKSAPKDYAALHQLYFPYIMNLCAKNGIDENNKEDVACEILVRLIEKDILDAFDPELVFEYQGEMRPARFKSFLARYVTKSVQGHRDRQNRIRRRENPICDVLMSEDESGTNKATWADLYGPPHKDHSEDIIDLVADDQEAARVRERLTEIPPRNNQDRCNLAELFDAVREQLLAYGEYDIKELQQRFHVGNTTMNNRVWWLKANLARIYGRPVPSRRPRKLGPKP
jgi:DNA-directed RNA polymerase specialized sigma24 family protein